MMNTEMLREFKEACNKIMDIETKPGAMLNYGKAYAKAGLGLFTEKEIQVQIPYILSNLSTWKGEEAKKVKTTLKNLEKDIKRG